MRILVHLALLSVLFAVPACEGLPRLAIDDWSVERDELVGRWQHPAGHVVEISDMSFERYGVRVERADGSVSERMIGRLTEAGGATFLELLINNPADDEPPVYHYARVEASGDSLRHAPLNPDWLAAQVDGSALRAGATEAGQPVAVTTDPDALRAVLARAATDPAAFQPAETLRRVRVR